MLRFGLQTEINKDLARVEWFGRGPHETMPDRKTSGVIGIHKCRAGEIQFPYIHPQENGNRSDVRWVDLLDQADKGIRIEADTDLLLNFSLWPYTQEDLRLAGHIHELPEREFNTINIDLAQRGVGDLQSMVYGWDPGTRLRKNRSYGLKFWIKPF